MGKHFCDCRAVCPYYLHEDKQLICCEGIRGDTVTHLAFARYPDYRQYKEEICTTWEWQKCPIAQMLDKKYEEADKE